MNNVVITGGGSGIGQALAIEFAKADYRVFIIGRNQKALHLTKQFNPDLIEGIEADIATVAGREFISQILGQVKIKYLVHNAAIVTPLAQIDQLDLNEWRYAQAVNVEGPLFLTQALLNNFADNSRILHISSGVAHRPLAGMLAYCSSKAALHMIYQILNLELNARGIVVGSFMPGVVDTNMQNNIRVSSTKQLPGVANFTNLKHNNELRNPEQVAAVIYNFLLKTTDEVFSQKDWRIDDLE